MMLTLYGLRLKLIIYWVGKRMQSKLWKIQEIKYKIKIKREIVSNTKEMVKY
jgi:hypothetical protein